MIAPETLLRMHPLDAVRAQIDEVIKPPLKASYLKIHSPVAIEGTRTQVQVSLDKSKAPVELWDLDKVQVFNYHRIDLQAFLKGVDLKVKSSLPISTQALLQAVFKRYGIPVADNDLVPAQYTSLGTANLISDETSWRWVGETTCTIVQLGIGLADKLLVRHYTLPFDVRFYSANIKARLTEYIQLANPSSMPEELTTAMFVLTDPQVNGPISAGGNTRIGLELNGKPYTGTEYITYQRRGFEDTFRRPVKLTGGQVGYTAELAGRLSTQMGCTITTSDIQSEVFPVLAVGEVRELAVNFHIKSLAYVGTVLVEYSRTS